eukprot:TRINITY_DN5572_c0_g1_i1.p1 TRINITY_DN5572_c0_g1~~TRINITY_DN5572_c0_g1_i1.p1  ORF type:complete len:537 (+),score=33.74 TRINITY_DN5572_c0_g1_i1:148-1611(+)
MGTKPSSVLPQPAALVFPQIDPTSKITFSRCAYCLNILAETMKEWQEAEYDNLRLLVTDLVEHLRWTHNINLNTAFREGLPLECFAGREAAARLIVHVYVNALLEIKLEPYRINRICSGRHLLRVLGLLGQITEQHIAYLILYAYLRHLAKPTEGTEQLLDHVLDGKYSICTDGGATSGALAKETLKKVFAAVPDAFFAPFQMLDLPEETPEEEIQTELLKQPPLIVRNELLCILENIALIDIQLPEEDSEIYGSIIAGFDVLLNNRHVLALSPPKKMTETAKCLLILLHELGHAKRYKGCSRTCWAKGTPPRFALAKDGEPEAGIYCIVRALGLTHDKYMALIKNMTPDLAAVVLNPEEWRDLERLKLNLEEFAAKHPLSPQVYKVSSLACCEKGTVTNCEIKGTPPKKKFKWGCAGCKEFNEFISRVGNLHKTIEEGEVKTATKYSADGGNQIIKITCTLSYVCIQNICFHVHGALGNLSEYAEL